MSQGMIPAARSAVLVLAIGGVCGLAWAAGLRGFMAELAGSGSDVGSYGTFMQILLPGVIAGVLLGWAEQIRRTGRRRGWRRGEGERQQCAQVPDPTHGRRRQGAVRFRSRRKRGWPW
jgi:hypothetical protein